jgi:hypothetical protein
MDCPICMDCIMDTVNCVTTDCGHRFHTSCLMKNTAINGYDCPCCRAQMAEEPDDSISSNDDDSSETDSFYDEAEEDFIMIGFRWFFQQINGEELEGDAEEYEELLKEERDWDEESETASDEAKLKIDNILLGLKKINTISYEELLKAFLHDHIDGLSVNHQAQDAFRKVSSTINTISERAWSR